jgi:DedD protein
VTDNDNLELKKRSRRRLVGAAALTLLAAIVLPMVMEKDPAPPTQDIQVTIPDRDADSALARPIAGRPSAGSEPPLVVPPEEPTSARAVPSEAPAASAAPSTKPLPPIPLSAPSAAAKPVERATPPSERPAPAAPIGDSARALALLEGKTPPAAGVESFVVQVGAFAESSKANSIGSDLKKRGFAAYTEKAGTVTRVRVGPFRNRDEAEKVAERLRVSGVKGVVVPR